MHPNPAVDAIEILTDPLTISLKALKKLKRCKGCKYLNKKFSPPKCEIYPAMRDMVACYKYELKLKSSNDTN